MSTDRRSTVVLRSAVWNSAALVSLLVVINSMAWLTASAREPQVVLFGLSSIYIFFVSAFWYFTTFPSFALDDGAMPSSRWTRFGIALAVVALSVEGIANLSHGIALDPGYTNYGADMIPKIFHAIRRVLNDRPMFELTGLRGTHVATHMPGLTLSFLPAALVDVDIRFMGALYYGLLLFSICRLASSATSPKEAGLFLLPLVGFFTLPGLVRAFLPMAHTAPWWLSLAVFCLAIHRGRYVIASIMLAIMLFMRETAVIIAAFYAIHLYKKFGLKVSATHLGCVGVVNILMWVPFFDAPGLAGAFFIKFNAPDRSWIEPTSRITVLNTIGFSNWFYLAGLGEWLRPMLILGLLAMILYYLVTSQPEGTQKLFFGCATALLWFLYFYGKPVIYEYIPVPILWTFGLLSAPRRALPAPVAEPRRGSAAIGAAAALPLVVLAVTGLLTVVTPHYRNPVRIDFVENRQDVSGTLYERESYAEGDFVWAGEGSLLISYPLKNIELPEGLSVAFRFKVRPYTCRGEREQQLEIFANREHVARIALEPDWHEYRVPVPTSSLRLGTNFFTLVPAFAVSPRSCGEQEDRLLSVAYDQILIDGAAPGEGESRFVPITK